MKRLIYLLLILISISASYAEDANCDLIQDAINNLNDYTKITSKQNNIADCKYGVELSAEWAQYILQNKNLCSCPKAYGFVEESFKNLMTLNQTDNFKLCKQVMKRTAKVSAAASFYISQCNP